MTLDMNSFLVLINENSGGVSSVGVKACIDKLHSVLPSAKFDFEIHGGNPSPLVQRAQDAIKQKHADCIITIGGDGTIAAIADAVSAGEIPLATLPGGTMNAFSRDLGYDANLLNAIEQLGDVKETSVDLAYAGEFAFLNNVVFGAYTSVAFSREHVREVDGLVEKAEALAEVAGAIAFSDTEKYRITIGGDTKTVETNTVMVANNIYEGAEMLRPIRSRVDRGVLGLYIAQSKTPFDFLNVLFDAVSSGLTESDLINIRECKSCRIETESGVLEATIDGEALELPSPIELSIKPKALKVLAPASSQG